MLQARSALTDAGNAARETRDLVPRLITEMGADHIGNLTGRQSRDRQPRAGALRAARATSATRCGRARCGRREPPARRSGSRESNDYLGQVIQGLHGHQYRPCAAEGPPGAEAEKRLKALDSLYTDLNGAVRRAVAAAPALPAAQTAARDVTHRCAGLGQRRRLAAPSRLPGEQGAGVAAAGAGLLSRWSLIVVRGVISSLRSAQDGRPVRRWPSRPNARRTTAISRRFCACSMSCRVSPTAI